MNGEDIQKQVLAMGQKARMASYQLAKLSTEQKNEILLAMAESLLANEHLILVANAKDLAEAEKNNASLAMLDRLMLNPERLKQIAQGIADVAELSDPTGKTIQEWERPNGIRIQKKKTPIGVIGIIYESRPNVTADAAVLCFKTGNATILRGGKEAIHSNRAIAKVLQSGGESAGMPPDSIQLIPFTDRESVSHMAEMDRYLDVIIPRGGIGLIEAVVSCARMPVIKHYDGICHIYVDEKADLSMAEEIILNAKTHKPGVCNAVETLLVHNKLAEMFYPQICNSLRDKGVEIYGDVKVQQHSSVPVVLASEKDWQTEYLDLVLSIKTVDSISDAISHINQYGSHHSDAIITSDSSAAERFLAEVDSSAVFWNASTRFNDGGEFGFGAEIGISTDKLHARGPMGLNELTSYKYLVIGEGQTR